MHAEVDAAEGFLALADSLMRNSDRLIATEGFDRNTTTAAALAIRLRADKRLAFRALVERWDLARIILETY